ncbi:hypothetical protein OSB04_018706 [Centaurea solstitialis]|uniref:TIR domain-containing protein n=1 Tax=Centaurea solstitialis TaxID=347529 RepID=A0AA38WN86_9ASTR|nr:hypothetical protein OSB04_018706 [Centaurea solstitialis]
MASSSSQSWEYDVFLSFRGEDTRNTFVDHLYYALHQRGIHTYKDDEKLPRGEAIGPSLFKAIEESQMAVIVFSENYAGSSWCLQELAHIMKCKDERRQIVIPIFYHVDPSDLRNQKRKYAEAFAKYESDNKNVESWRKALVDAGNLSGYVANRSTREAEFIKQIVDTISNGWCAPISSNDKDLIGIESRLQDLKSKMEMVSDGVLMVGIWGLGGGGKTTLASSLYHEISCKFDGSCFIKDVREKSSKDGLEKLQKEILSLVLKLKTEEVIGDVGRLIQRRFQHKKVLMVLDDVDHLDQLKELAGSNAWFGKGSRILITTRDNFLLTAHKVNAVYNISLLNDEEAIKLFNKHAFLEHGTVEDYKMLSKKVVSYVGGHPLALIVLGSFLRGRNMSEWKSALARLKDIPESGIVERLKISFDGLKPMEKELFLDIAWVEVLIEKALITVSKAGKFEMHDLIEEMGHYIVRGENPKNPELHSRVWQWKDIAKMDTRKENDSVKALKVWFFPDRDIPLSSLPLVIGNMKKLRWFYLVRYPAISFSREFQPTELCYLRLEESLVEKLWEGYKHLPNLKVLNLAYSRKLIRTPNFDGLPCLERMTLEYCTSLKEIHPSIGYHERLISLDMANCTSLELFPPIFRMKKLKSLLLTGCSKLCKFPEIQTNMDNLVELHLRRSGIEVVPSSIGKFCTNLTSLDLSDCEHLESIEGNFHLLKHLEELYLQGCGQLKNMPVEGLFDVECCLQQLSLSLASFKNFQQGAVNELLGFPRLLTRLSLSFCRLVDGDISSVSFEELSNLQALELSCNRFLRLHSSLSQLPRLKYLNLSYCHDLVELPDLPSSIAVLVAYKCESLKLVGDFPTNYKWLWKVLLPANNRNGGKRVVQSMWHQGNATKNYFLSVRFDAPCLWIRGCKLGVFSLLLPWNWYNEFSGFLVYVDDRHMDKKIVIIMKDVMDRENEDDVLEVSNKVTRRKRLKRVGRKRLKRVGRMCYIPFNSLKHTSWWNSTHTAISFFIREDVLLKAKLVPTISQGDNSIERTNDRTYHSGFWDDESPYRKTFEIVRDSRSSIEIEWSHDDCFYMYGRI